jgi:hypothetical protein
VTNAKPPRINYALWWFIVLAGALLVTALTLPLLDRSVALFGVIAGVCWLAVFAIAIALTRAMNRAPAVDDESGDQVDVSPPAETPTE